MNKIRTATLEDANPHWLATAYNQNMAVFRVRKVVTQERHGPSLKVFLLEGGLRLYATELHAFPCLRGIDKSEKLMKDLLASRGVATLSGDIQPDDWIWIPVVDAILRGDLVKEVRGK